jgi:hypothetical protein
MRDNLSPHQDLTRFVKIGLQGSHGCGYDAASEA